MFDQTEAKKEVFNIYVCLLENVIISILAKLTQFSYK